jgi:opacity protein-like surface antigen
MTHRSHRASHGKPLCARAGFAHLALGLTIIAYGAKSFGASNLPPEVGWDYGDVDTGRGAALSGAQRSFSTSYGALLSNPANMVSSRVYHVGALASIWPEASRQTYGAAIVDSSTSSTRLAGGFAALWTVQDHNGINRLGSDLRLGLALPFSEKFRAGVTGRYISLRENGNGPLGSSLASGGLHDKSIVRGFGIDVGATFQPTPSIAASLVGTGLNGAGTGFQPTVLGGGLGWSANNFTLEGNGVADFTTWERTTMRLMAGAEYVLAEHYPLRAGYRWDSGLHAHAASAGLGYISSVFSLEVGARRSFGEFGATAIVFSFAYHVESSGVGSAGGESY